MAATPIKTWTKDPNAVLDYTISWKAWLKGDSISTVTWTVPVGVTNVGATKSVETATIMLSGGTAGTSYQVACLIVTAGGRTDERTVQYNVEDR